MRCCLWMTSQIIAQSVNIHISIVISHQRKKPPRWELGQSLVHMFWNLTMCYTYKDETNLTFIIFILWYKIHLRNKNLGISQKLFCSKWKILYIVYKYLAQKNEGLNKSYHDTIYPHMITLLTFLVNYYAFISEIKDGVCNNNKIHITLIQTLPV